MKGSLRLVSTFLLSVTLSACDNKGSPMEQTNAESSQLDSDDRGLAHLNLNLNPTAGYTIRLKIDNAPGPFKIVQLGGQFDVRNEDECGKINDATGTAGRITSSEDLSLTRISDNEYEAVLHLDKMHDEDYYGCGVCHWELTRAYAVLIAADEAKDTSFSLSLPVHEMMEKGSATRYFVQADYPRVEEVDGYPATGKITPEEFLPEYRAHVFSMTLSSLGAAE